MRKSKMAFVLGEKRVIIMHNVNQSGQYSVAISIFERTNRFTFVQLSIQDV